MGLWPTTVHEKELDSRLRGNDREGAMPPPGGVTPAKAGVHSRPLTSFRAAKAVAIFATRLREFLASLYRHDASISSSVRLLVSGTNRRQKTSAATHSAA